MNGRTVHFTRAQAGILIIALIILSIRPVFSQTTELRVSVQNIAPTLNNSNLECNEPVVLTSGLTTRLYCNVTASDQNGWQDIYRIDAMLWYNNTANKSSADNYLNHYSMVNCNLTSGSELSRTAECYFDMQFFADPGEWTIEFNASDQAGTWQVYNVSYITVVDFLALSATGIINFGSMLPGQISQDVKSAVINNTCNQEIDLLLDAPSAITCVTGGIPLSNIHYDSLSTDYGSMCGSLTTDADDTCYRLSQSFNLQKSQTKTGNVEVPTKNTYWHISVPEGVSGLCNGTVTYTAIKST